MDDQLELIKEKTEPKAKRIVFVFIVISLLVIGGLYYFYIQLSPGLNSKILYYMYTDECPNCQIVKQWMLDNNFDEQLRTLNINITRLNMDNALSLPYFNKATKACELPITSVGVPFLYHNGKCFIGRIEVIDYLNMSIGLI